MTYAETRVAHAETSDSVTHLLSLNKLLAEALSLLGSGPEMLSEMRGMDASLAPTPEQIARWRAEIEAFIDQLRSAREVRRQKALAAVAAARKDQATGLPGLTSAQAELEKALSREQPPAVAVLVFKQLRPLNARFGRAVGDEILAATASELTRLLADFGPLFRWNGPAFLLISKSGQMKHDVLEGRLNALGTNGIEKTIDVPDRAIHLKITFSSHVQKLERSSDLVQVSRTLDEIVTMHA